MDYINESNYYYLKRENLGKYAYAKTDINKGVNLGLAYEKVKDTGVFIDDFDFYTPTVEIVDANNNLNLIKTKITRGNVDRDGYMFVTNKKIFKDTKFTISYNDCCKYFSQYKEFEPLVESFITEAATNSSERKYKCPFCDFRDTRENLVYHVDDEHQDMIPEGYTPARVIFNYLNKKTHGTCIMCKQETDWNEKNWKYERLCNRKKCHDDYVKMMKGRMINKYGKPHLLDDEDKQKEMLNNRSISGEYKFKDGGIRTYVGSYEKATLEFYDKVLDVHSKDIMTPGPSIEYEYGGKKHIWITDIFYIPVNLVHDVKDGGNNPNTRDMKDYRKKQIAKEKAIEKLNQYNYIRLTDNNFAQLLLILAELKNMMINDDKSYITRINENGLAGISAIPSLNGSDSIHVIPYLKNNAFSGTAICKGNDMNNMYAIKNNKIENIAIDELDESKYKIYKYKKPVSKEKLQKITKDFEEGVIVEDSYFYEMLTDKKLLNLEQYEYDDDFEESIDIFEEYELIKDITEATLVHEFNQLYDRNYYVPVMNTKDNMVIKSLLKEYNNLNISQDIGGYFVYNESKNIRSKSYKTINEINVNLLKIMM